MCEEWKKNLVSSDLNQSLNFISSVLRLFFPDIWILEAHSMFVYKASWMYILYIVDLPNLCSVSQILLLIVGMFTKNICSCSNQRLFTSGFFFFFFVCLSPRFFLLSSSVRFSIRWTYASDGLSFRKCAIKVFWVLYFAQGKLYGCHRCCILKQIFILLMLRNIENKIEL